MELPTNVGCLTNWFGIGMRVIYDHFYGRGGGGGGRNPSNYGLIKLLMMTQPGCPALHLEQVVAQLGLALGRQVLLEGGTRLLEGGT